MTPQFAVTVRADAIGPQMSLKVESARGVSMGTSPDRSITVVILGVDGGEDQASALADRFAQSGSDPALLAYSDIGAAALEHCSGKVTVITPPLGLRQVFWASDAGELGLASEPAALATIGRRPALIRPETLFYYIYFHMIPGPQTILAGVSKLDGGHCLRWNGRETKQERYWRPVFEDRPQTSEPAAAAELLEILGSAVASALEDAPHPGAFLSGGLDSSTVAGLASRIRSGIPTVSMGFDAAGYDEMDYARIASRHFGTTPLEYYVTPEDILLTLPRITAAFAEPFGNSSAAAAYQCARIAREHGLDLLLAGDGGDELFGGNERYATQLIFERYKRIPAPIRNAVIEPAVSAAARISTRFPIGKARGYIEKAGVPLPDRLQSYNFLHRHDPADVFSPELLAQVDAALPLRMLREEYVVPATQSAINRMLFLDWKFTLHDNDLVKVNTMCDLAGVRVAYPMLNQRVVDFSLRIPGNWKVRNGELRWFYKRAMQGFLPDAIIRKTKHGFGLPFGVWTRTHEGLRRLAEDSLESLRHRGYFRPEFLQEALRLHRDDHASYYGELVWILMTLELWLQAHVPGARL